MESKELARNLARAIAYSTPERGWTKEELADFTRELEWVFTAPPTEEELAEARALMAKMDAIAEQRKGAVTTSRIVFRSPRNSARGHD